MRPFTVALLLITTALGCKTPVKPDDSGALEGTTAELSLATVRSDLETATQAIMTGLDSSRSRSYVEHREWACTTDDAPPAFLRELGNDTWRLCYRGNLVEFQLVAAPHGVKGAGWCVVGEHRTAVYPEHWEELEDDEWVWDVHRVTVLPFFVASRAECTRQAPPEAIWQNVPFPNDPLRAQSLLFAPHRVELSELVTSVEGMDKYDECCAYSTSFESEGFMVTATGWGHGGSPDEAWSIDVETPQHQFTFKAEGAVVTEDRNRIYYGKPTELYSAELMDEPEADQAVQAYADRLGVSVEAVRAQVYEGDRGGVARVDELVEIDLAAGTETPLGVLMSELEKKAPQGIELIHSSFFGETRVEELVPERARLHVEETPDGMRIETVTLLSLPELGLRLSRKARLSQPKDVEPPQ